MSQYERFYILLNLRVGKKREKGLLKSTTKVEVLPGTLLNFLERSGNPEYFVFETVDSDNVEVSCSHADFKELSKEQYELLLPIPVVNERLTTFSNKEWLQEGSSLKIGDGVEVYIKGQAGSGDFIGILRYKGPVEGVPGIYFGVELINNPGIGNSDGVFRKHRFFACKPDTAVFVGLHRIRKCVLPSNQSAGSQSHRAPRKVEGAEGGYMNHAPMAGLAVNTRVVWVSDTGPEAGVVKWIGLLPGADQRSEEFTVGVEFDNPVGSGTGKYKDQRLFSAKQGHASLVPILGLLKEAEFLGQETKPAHNEIDNDIVAFTDSGKSQKEVIAEQYKIIQEAHRNLSPRSPSEVPFGMEPRSELKSYEIIDKAEIHPPPAAHQGFSGSGGGVNPLYEISRHKGEYLPEGLGSSVSEVLSHGSAGPNVSNHSRQKSLPDPDPDLERGSLVEVMSSPSLYGVIKWIGHLPDQKEPKKLIAGLEMEEEISAGTDGTFRQHRLFHCPQRKGFFVPLYKCRKDKRFLEEQHRRSRSSDINFGSTETPDLPGTISPPDSLEDFGVVCGKGRGIQGHHNSCYMDASLLAMFYFTSVFDSILHRKRVATDLPEYEEIQQVLKEGIVNPLRRHHYVRADKVMKLRMLLDKVGKIPGMMSEEKDPEEFLNLLLNEITNADPFLKISSGDNQETQHTYFYQLIMEKDERLVLPTTQQLFELSFLQMGIKLKEVPSCLIIQMPRFGKDYKMYKRILPSLELDITDVLENAPRECIICGDLAMFECKECYQVHGAGLNTIAFCDVCKRTSHQHKQRVNHKPRQIYVPSLYRDDYLNRKALNGQQVAIPREKMELFAVICIQTSHYVSFVKSGRGKKAKWIFFDSMADRMGELNGYNIPEICEISEITEWLSDKCYNDIMKYPEDKTLPEHMRRLICDAYICMYQSPEVMMFT